MKTFSRREFCALTAASVASVHHLEAWAAPIKGTYELVASTDRNRILSAADKYLADPAITVTASHSERSPGGPHDFYSEGDYWWPDPKNPGGPYIRRDVPSFLAGSCFMPSDHSSRNEALKKWTSPVSRASIQMIGSFE